MEMGNRMRTKMRTDTLFNIMNTLQVVGITGMAGVAQLVELWIVIPVVEGSSPFARPSFSSTDKISNKILPSFFCLRA